MTDKISKHDVLTIERKIVTIRDQKVILDRDLAMLYGVPTFRFNEAIKCNLKRFPGDFMFQLTSGEFASLTSHFAMSNPGRGRWIFGDNLQAMKTLLEMKKKGK